MSTMSKPSSQLSVFRGSTVLVTGAGGFIGKQLLENLNNLAAHVVCVNRKSVSGIVGNNLSNTEELEQVFKLAEKSRGKSIEYVFHLAGQKSSSIARENPVETLKTSFNSTLNLLESARKLGTVKKVVLISSLAVYGLNEDHSSELLKESDSIHYDSVYSATKINTESLGISYYMDFGVPVAIARLANVYGPNQSEAAVIPSLISQMKAGQTISMGNTLSVRDFINVQDVVDALLHIAACDEATGRVFNVCTSQGTSIKMIADMLSKKLGYIGQIIIDEKKIRKNEKNFLVADNSEIKRKIGWFPKITIETGLENLCQ